ncbi:MAG: hypothetical protein ACXWCV_09690 [Caldimonas sp.]
MANPLTAGTASDLGDSMAAAIDAAMQEEWQSAYGAPLPGGAGELDRRILFAAVAKGVLRYLYAHRADLVTDVVHDDITNGHSHQMAFDLSDA